jgi:hypothetical protein
MEYANDKDCPPENIHHSPQVDKALVKLEQDDAIVAPPELTETEVVFDYKDYTITPTGLGRDKVLTTEDVERIMLTDQWADVWGGLDKALDYLNFLNQKILTGLALVTNEIDDILFLRYKFLHPEIDINKYIQVNSPACPPDIIGSYRYKFKSAFRGIFNTIKQVVRTAKQIVGIVNETIDTISGVISGAVDLASKIKKDPKGMLKKLGAKIFDIVKDIEDQVLGQIIRNSCLTTYDEQISGIKDDISSAVNKGMKFLSPKQRKLIKENDQAKAEFTKNQTDTIKATTAEATEKKITKDIATESGTVYDAVNDITSSSSVPSAPSSTPTTASTPVDIAFVPGEFPELVSSTFTYSTYRVSSGTVKAFLGSRGNILYTEPASAIKYFARS